MNKILLIIIFIFFSKITYANNLFNSSFYDVEFVSDKIEDEKLNKINQIKKTSIINILQKTLNYAQYIELKDNLSDDLINTFVKNILIEDERIIDDKYYSKIKINFDKNTLIQFYRDNKIPYVEYLPDKILLIIVEENPINNNLFTENNRFYSYYKKNLQKNNIFKIPNLDINDRYILKKEHIDNRNLEKISNFSKKYKLDDIILVTAKINNYNKVLYNFALFSNGSIIEKKLNFDKFDFENFFKILEKEAVDIWKKINQIQNDSLNIINCDVKYFSMLELKEIRNNLNNISIIQDLFIKSISYKHIEYEIYFYGNAKMLFNIFALNQLNISDIESNCKIKLK